MKGSGYRSITADTHRIDPVLAIACEAAGIALEDFSRAIFKRGTDHIMFINPGEVRIRNGALLTTSSSVVWSALPQPAPVPYVSSQNGLTTPGGSTIHGGNMHNVNVTGGHHGGGPGMHSGTLSRGGIFTPSAHSHMHHQSHMSYGQSSQHGSMHSGYGGGGGGGRQHGLAPGSINAPSWAPMDNNNQHYNPRTPKKQQ